MQKESGWWAGDAHDAERHRMVSPPTGSTNHRGQLGFWRVFQHSCLDKWPKELQRRDLQSGGGEERPPRAQRDLLLLPLPSCSCRVWITFGEGVIQDHLGPHRASQATNHKESQAKVWGNRSRLEENTITPWCSQVSGNVAWWTGQPALGSNTSWREGGVGPAHVSQHLHFMAVRQPQLTPSSPECLEDTGSKADHLSASPSKYRQALLTMLPDHGHPLCLCLKP